MSGLLGIKWGSGWCCAWFGEDILEWVRMCKVVSGFEGSDQGELNSSGSESLCETWQDMFRFLRRIYWQQVKVLLWTWGMWWTFTVTITRTFQCFNRNIVDAFNSIFLILSNSTLKTLIFGKRTTFCHFSVHCAIFIHRYI